jgi:hypothetical protein
MHKFAMFLPLSLLTIVAFFPRVLPSMTNRWYSVIGMKTKVNEADYSKLGTRGAGFVLFVFVVGWMIKEILSK